MGEVSAKKKKKTTLRKRENKNEKGRVFFFPLNWFRLSESPCSPVSLSIQYSAAVHNIIYVIFSIDSGRSR